MIVDGFVASNLDQAVLALNSGELIGLPTETVYGLAAHADDSAAVAKIFSTKGRPSDHPLIVHLANPQDAAYFAAKIPDFAQTLMRAFWPGPLTLILPRREGIASAAAGGHATIGLRCPAHPVAHALLLACKEKGIAGLAAPSANRFGRVSPTTAGHVAQEFSADLLILDGGACQVGIESTIVDCTRDAAVVLRPGIITNEHIAHACRQGAPAALSLAAASAPKASGTLEAHYAPQAKLRLMDAPTLQTALDVLGNDAPRLGVYARSPLRGVPPQVVHRTMPEQAQQAAQELFATLRAFDDEKVLLLWVETPPPTPEWEGVSDRLHRAAASASH